MNIASNLTINDWKDLVGDPENLKINFVANERWDSVFYFFEERIKTRYLNPIKAILEMDLKTGEGFAVVNLQCSLIETIECFINGWIYNTERDKSKEIIANRWYGKKIEKNNLIEIEKADKDKSLKNVDIFISFFKNREPFNIYQIKGEMFFWNVRCALLHETQTKNSWKILAKGKGKSIENKTIYRNDFQKDIENLIQKYKNAILKGEDFYEIKGNVLRENFISKFNHICKISQEQ